MHKLIIDPTGGFAGDMFAAALINAGADEVYVTKSMQKAAEMIGKASVTHLLTTDKSSRLLIEIEHHHGHLSSIKAKELLTELFKISDIPTQYQQLGYDILSNLIEAENIAHSTYDFKMDNHHHHHHHDATEFNQNKKEPKAWLHEAQDILIDIMGAVTGLSNLKTPITAKLIAPVSYGGGSISFSHGTVKIPAPATQVMIDNKNIPVQEGPVNSELFTPTGAAILCALKANELTEEPKNDLYTTGQSRGTKELPIPPLKIMLYK
ncbi:DUF111 family protein [Marinilabiliaceae bacterium ANBcel2]|nr:DUF111 family protein [Marinilabiliaceae bacterium ANBcel2]